MRQIHRLYDEGNCYIHRLYNEDLEPADPTRYTELDEKYGDDFDGMISYTSSSTMERPSLVVNGDVPRARDNHYETVDEGRDDGLLRVVATKHIVIEGFGVIEPGQKGGLIESEDNLEQGTGGWVGEYAVVLDDAVVADGALVLGGHTHPSQRCMLTGSSFVADGALVFDTFLSDSASIEGNIEVYESVLTGGSFAYGDRNGKRSTVLIDTIMQDESTVGVNPTPQGTPTEEYEFVSANPILRGCHLTQKSSVGGEANLQDTILVDSAIVYGRARLVNSIIGGDTRVYEDAVVENSTVRGGSIICGSAHVSHELDITDSVVS